MVPTALVTLARLGVSTSYLGIIGDDEEGAAICDGLEKEGIDISRVVVDAGTVSRVVLVLVDSDSGERSFIPRRDSCRCLSAADLDRDLIASARILHLDDAADVSVEAAQWAREAGVSVVYDGTWAHAALDALLPMVDTAVVGEAFAKDWQPHATPEQVAQLLLASGARTAVVTLGSRGCVAAAEGQLIHCPAYPVDVVDTTGAGDAFHGGFIYGMLRNWQLLKCLRFASAVGALNCRQLRGRSGLPDAETVERFLKLRESRAEDATSITAD